MAKDENDKDKEEAGGKSGPSTMKIVIIAVVLALVFGGGLVGATFYFVTNMNEEEAVVDQAEGEDGEEAAEEAEPAAPAQYHSMDPKFVVSFGDQTKARFMQFSLEIMSRDSEVIKKIQDHSPVIRSSLLMLFGSQSYDVMVTREGKEQLLQDAVNDINASLQKISGAQEPVKAVEAAYFNSFVIQ